MLKSCQECGALFSHESRTLCAACLQARGDEFTTIKKYLRKTPQANLQMIARGTGLPLKLVREFVADGRLTMHSRDAQTVCSICGQEIFTGGVCRQCQVASSRDGRHGRMHTRDSVLKKRK